MLKSLLDVAPLNTDLRKCIAQTATGRSTAEYEKNREIFCQGDPADSIFFMHEGEVKVSVSSAQGKGAIVAILHEGQFFGEGCLNRRVLRTCTATTITNCRITMITQAAMLAALQEHPKFSEMFIAHLVARNGRIEDDFVDQMFNLSEKRLARLLLRLSNYENEGSAPIVPIRHSQEMLAEMIGTTRSRVSFFMNKFRKLGLISYGGEIDVHRSLMIAVMDDSQITGINRKVPTLDPSRQTEDQSSSTT